MAGAEDSGRTDAAPEHAEQAEQAELYGCPRTESRGQVVVHPTRDTYLDTVKALTDDGYVMCVDLTVVDYLAYEGRALPEGITAERFEVVVNFLDIEVGRRVRLRRAGARRRPDAADAVRHPSRHRGDGARGLRHVRHHVRRPPRPVADPDAGGLGRAPVAQGLRDRLDPGAVQGSQLRWVRSLRRLRSLSCLAAAGAAGPKRADARPDHRRSLRTGIAP